MGLDEYTHAGRASHEGAELPPGVVSPVAAVQSKLPFRSLADIIAGQIAGRRRSRIRRWSRFGRKIRRTERRHRRMTEPEVEAEMQKARGRYLRRYLKLLRSEADRSSG